jgi:hypothetical protein
VLNGHGSCCYGRWDGRKVAAPAGGVVAR